MITLVRRASWALAAPAAVAAVLALAPAASAATSTPARGNATAWWHRPVPRSCRASDLGVWVASGQGSGAAGTVFYPLQFTNLSHHTCRLRGYPWVVAVSRAGHWLGRAARRNPVYPVRTVSLGPGRTAHAVLGYGSVVVGACAARHRRPAFRLRVTPPHRRKVTHALFGLDVCSARGSVFMTVSAIHQGPGRA